MKTEQNFHQVHPIDQMVVQPFSFCVLCFVFCVFVVGCCCWLLLFVVVVVVVVLVFVSGVPCVVAKHFTEQQIS